MANNFLSYLIRSSDDVRNQNIAQQQQQEAMRIQREQRIQAQQQLAEQRRLEEERRRQEAEAKARAEQEKREAEARKKQAEAEAKRAEADAKIANARKKIAEAQRGIETGNATVKAAKKKSEDAMENIRKYLTKGSKAETEGFNAIDVAKSTAQGGNEFFRNMNVNLPAVLTDVASTNLINNAQKRYVGAIDEFGQQDYEEVMNPDYKPIDNTHYGDVFRNSAYNNMYNAYNELLANKLEGSKLGGFFNSIGNQVPTALLGNVGGNVASLGAMGAGVLGSTAEQALKEGYGVNPAFLYGLANAGVEVGTELLNPKIPGVGNMSFGDLINEGAEEVIGEYLQPFAETALGEKNFGDAFREVATLDKAKQALEAGITGTLSAGVMQGAGEVMRGGGTLTDTLTGQSNYTRATSDLDTEIEMAEQAVAMNPNDKYAQDELNTLRAMKTDAQRQFATAENLRSDDVDTKRAARSANADIIEETAKRYGAKVSNSELSNIVRIANKVGARVEFTDGQIGGSDGYQLADGTIMINANAENPALTIFTHELTHDTMGTRQYESLANTLIDMYENGDINADVDSITNSDLTDEQKRNEIVAVLAQNVLGNETSLKRLAKNNGNALSYMAEQIKNYVTNDKQGAKLAKVERAMQKAIKNADTTKLETSNAFSEKSTSFMKMLKEIFDEKEAKRLYATFRDNWSDGSKQFKKDLLDMVANHYDETHDDSWDDGNEEKFLNAMNEHFEFKERKEDEIPFVDPDKKVESAGLRSGQMANLFEQRVEKAKAEGKYQKNINPTENKVEKPVTESKEYENIPFDNEQTWNDQLDIAKENIKTLNWWLKNEVKQDGNYLTNKEVDSLTDIDQAYEVLDELEALAGMDNLNEDDYYDQLSTIMDAHEQYQIKEAERKKVYRERKAAEEEAERQARINQLRSDSASRANARRFLNRGSSAERIVNQRIAQANKRADTVNATPPVTIEENQTADVETKAETPVAKSEHFRNTIETSAQSINKNSTAKEINSAFKAIQDDARKVASETEWRTKERKISKKSAKKLGDVLKAELSTRNIEAEKLDLSYSKKDSKIKYKVFKNVKAEDFRDMFEICRTFTDNGELVDLHGVENSYYDDGSLASIGYKYCNNYLSEDGLSGFSITPDGDLISVYNLNPQGGWLRSIAPIIKENAKTLDCFISPDENLRDMYEHVFGFKTASIMDWNWEYNHDKIGENHKEPPVAFMVNTNEDVQVKNFGKTEYDEAKAYRDEFIPKSDSAIPSEEETYEATVAQENTDETQKVPETPVKTDTEISDEQKTFEKVVEQKADSSKDTPAETTEKPKKPRKQRKQKAQKQTTQKTEQDIYEDVVEGKKDTAPSEPASVSEPEEIEIESFDIGDRITDGTSTAEVVDIEDNGDLRIRYDSGITETISNDGEWTRANGRVEQTTPKAEEKEYTSDRFKVDDKVTADGKTGRISHIYSNGAVLVKFDELGARDKIVQPQDFESVFDGKTQTAEPVQETVAETETPAQEMRTEPTSTEPVVETAKEQVETPAQTYSLAERPANTSEENRANDSESEKEKYLKSVRDELTYVDKDGYVRVKEKTVDSIAEMLLSPNRNAKEAGEEILKSNLLKTIDTMNSHADAVVDDTVNDLRKIAEITEEEDPLPKPASIENAKKKLSKEENGLVNANDRKKVNSDIRKATEDTSRTKVSDERALETADKFIENHGGLEGSKDYFLNKKSDRSKVVSMYDIAIMGRWLEMHSEKRDSYMKDNDISINKNGTYIKDGQALDKNSEEYQTLLRMGNDQVAMFKRMSQSASYAGSALHMIQAFLKTSPEVRKNLFNAEIDEINETIKKNFSKKLKNGKVQLIPHLTEEEWNSYINAETDAEREKAMEAIERRVGEQIPADWVERRRAWRYLMMLANPQTHMRNIVSNTLMQVMTTDKNLHAYLTEAIVRKVVNGKKMNNGQAVEFENSRYNDNGKMVGFNMFNKSDRAMMDAVGEYYNKNIANRYSVESKYDARSGFSKYRNYFHSKKSNALIKLLGGGADAISKWNSKMLSVEDDWMTIPRYQMEMTRLLKAEGYTLNDGKFVKNGTEITEDEMSRISDRAYDEAVETTFHDVNELAKSINKIGELNSVARVGVGATMPFTTTPLNIGRRIYEYSPLALARNIIGGYNKVVEGKMSANQWANNLAKGLTGTEIAMIGFFLAKAGILRGNDKDEDYKETAYKQDIGLSQDYSLVIPKDRTKPMDDDENVGGFYSIDWAGPNGSLLLLGAQAYNTTASSPWKKGKKESILDYAERMGVNVMDMFAEMMSPLIDTTMLSGLQGVGDAYYYDKAAGGSGWGGVVKQMISSYIGQYTPTLGGKTRNVIDPVKRSTYSNNSIDSIIRQGIKKAPLTEWAINAVTGTDEYLEPSINLKGEVEKNEGDTVLERAFLNYVSPGIYTSNKAEKSDYELLDLYEKYGDNAILPDAIKNIDGVKLTPKERTKINRYYGKNYQSELKSFVESPIYKNQTTEYKGNLLKKVEKHVENNAKTKYYESVGSPEDILSQSDIGVNNLKSQGVDNWQSYSVMSITNDLDSNGDTIKNSGSIRKLIAYENMGVADYIKSDVKKHEDDSNYAYNTYGLSKTVLGWSDAKLSSKWEELLNKTATGEQSYLSGDAKSSSGSTGNGTSGTGSGKSSGKTSGRTSSKKSSSSSTDDEMLKLYEKILKGEISATKSAVSKLKTKLDLDQSDYDRIMSNHKSKMKGLDLWGMN